MIGSQLGRVLDVWRIYEDVCVIWAGICMSVWQNTLTPALAGLLRYPDSWTNTRVPPRGEDDFTHVRTRGQGIEGRPPSSAPRGCRAFKRVSAMSPSRGWAAARQMGAPPCPLRRPPRPPTGSCSFQGRAAAHPSYARDGAARAAGGNYARAAQRVPRAHGRGVLAVRGST